MQSKEPTRFREVQFPSAYPIGDYYFQERNSGSLVGPIAEAQGKISVPEDAALIVHLNEDALSDRLKLEAVANDCIDGLRINTIASFAPLKVLSNWKKLKWLDLTGAVNLTDDDLDWIKQLSRLKHLSLAHTPISDRGFAPLACLSQLESLSLLATRIKGSGLQALKAMPDLRELDLSYCEISLKQLEDFDFSNLRNLRLSGIKSGDDADSRLPMMPALVNLDLSYSSIGDALAQSVLQCKSLETIDISGMRNFSQALEACCELPGLKLLRANAVQLQPSDIELVSRQSALEELDLDGASWPENSFSAIKNLQTLVRFSCSNSLLSDTEVEAISHVPTLEKLTVFNTRITENGLDTFAKQRTGCVIVSERSLNNGFPEPAAFIYKMLWQAMLRFFDEHGFWPVVPARIDQSLRAAIQRDELTAKYVLDELDSWSHSLDSSRNPDAKSGWRNGGITEAYGEIAILLFVASLHLLWLDAPASALRKFIKLFERHFEGLGETNADFVAAVVDLYNEVFGRSHFLAEELLSLKRLMEKPGTANGAHYAEQINGLQRSILRCTAGYRQALPTEINESLNELRKKLAAGIRIERLQEKTKAAITLLKTERFIESEKAFKEALRLYASLDDCGDKAARFAHVEALYGLARIAYGKEQFPECERLCERAIDAGLGNDASASRGAELLILQVSCKLRLSKHDDARKLLQSAHKSLEHESEHKQLFAGVLNLYGELERVSRNFTAAQKYLQQSLAMRKQILGEEHIELASSYANLAKLFRDVGVASEARTNFERALEIYDSTGKEDAETLDLLTEFANFMRKSNKVDRAEQLEVRAKSIRKRIQAS